MSRRARSGAGRKCRSAASRTPLAEIEDDLRRRDERDTTRTEAPLRAADDALVLDTSSLNRDEAMAEAIRLAELRLAES